LGVDVDLKQLRYFIAIVDAGSVTEASHRLHVVQPAVSQRLAALEAELGVPLLLRTKMGMTTTPAGDELYVRARQIIQHVAAAEVAAREKGGQIGGRVGIGLLRSVASIVAAPLFRELRAQYPEIIPELVVGYSADLVEDVNACRIDLALRDLRPGVEEPGARVVFKESICLLGAPRTLDLLPASLGLSDLQKVPLLVSPTSPIHERLRTLAQEAGVPFQIIGSLESSGATVELCAQGYAATFMSEAKAKLVVNNSAGQLIMRRLDGFDRAIAIYSNPQVTKPPSIQAAETVLADVLQRLIAQRMQAPQMRSPAAVPRHNV
jgi:DNA-binding transcriptional LysR family regulator